MKTKILQLFVIAFLAVGFQRIQAQEAVRILPFDTFMVWVKTNHPVAIQAQLAVGQGNAKLMKTRGMFDPKLFTEVAQKYYDDKQYYALFDGGLKIPTWFGIELQGGFEQNKGVYLNPENNTPDNGLWYAGLSVPIGQGLFIDERRAELKKAKIYVDISETERQIMLNDVLYDAGKTYWDWFNAHNNLMVYENALELAEQRFNAVRQGAELGDRPYIDTLEAGIQVQNRNLSLLQAQLEYKNATALLEVYLWAEGVIPLVLQETIHPNNMEEVLPTISEDYPISVYDSLVTNHPKLQQFDLKLDQLGVQQRWQREQLKPQLNIKYNPITSPTDDSWLGTFNENNYTFGVQFAMPMFLRKERGNLKMVNYQMQALSAQSELAAVSLLYKVKASFNEWDATNKQVRLYNQTVTDYQSLLEGERQLFDKGESSLFMVNSRELGYINARVKQIKLLTNNKKASLTAAYAMGILWK
jgi:outer membrane protein TolC